VEEENILNIPFLGKVMGLIITKKYTEIISEQFLDGGL
jgi:hypothetical protein